MSGESNMEKPNFDPGGGRRSSPPIELCPQRLAVATNLFQKQTADGNGRIKSIELDFNAMDLSQRPGEGRDSSGAHINGAHGVTKKDQEYDSVTELSRDSGLGGSMVTEASFNTKPIAAHMLDSMPVSEVSLAGSIPASDHGYDSLCASDYSSFNSTSSGAFDSGVVTFRNKTHGANNVSRRCSDSPLTTSRTPHNTRSWHDGTSRETLRNFAHKMNYTDEEFERSMKELGDGHTDRDRLLNHLIKLRGVQPSPLAAEGAKPTKTTTKAASSKPATQKSEGDSKGLRRIVIDGSNVAMEHGLHQIYSCRGIEIVVKYFQQRGHESITVFVPAHRLRTERLITKDQHILNELSKKGVVVKTPSRKSSKGHIASYEDRFILKLASMENAIVISNDQFRDLKGESSSFKETIEKRILPFVFVADQFIPAEDPLGKKGPTLEQFLRVDPYHTNSGMCPYGRKCTYGTKCKFGHPEREETCDSALGDMWTSREQSSVSMSQQPSSSMPLPFDSYMNPLPKFMATTSTSNYPPFYQPHNSTNSTSNMVQNRYYSPADITRYQHPGGYHEFPPSMGVMSSVPPALRASVHDQSYHSMPDDVQYHSRHPGQPTVTSAQDSNTSSFLTSTPSYSSVDSTSFSDLTSSDMGPQPLNEHLSTSYSNASTLPTTDRPSAHHHRTRPNYNAPILEGDPRYKIYFHMMNLFPEKLVRRVMNQYPNELNPNKLTSMVLELQSKVKVDC